MFKGETNQCGGNSCSKNAELGCSGKQHNRWPADQWREITHGADGDKDKNRKELVGNTAFVQYNKESFFAGMIGYG